MNAKPSKAFIFMVFFNIILLSAKMSAPLFFSYIVYDHVQYADFSHSQTDVDNLRIVVDSTNIPQSYLGVPFSSETIGAEKITIKGLFNSSSRLHFEIYYNIDTAKSYRVYLNYTSSYIAYLSSFSVTIKYVLEDDTEKTLLLTENASSVFTQVIASAKKVTFEISAVGRIGHTVSITAVIGVYEQKYSYQTGSLEFLNAYNDYFFIVLLILLMGFYIALIFNKPVLSFIFLLMAIMLFIVGMIDLAYTLWLWSNYNPLSTTFRAVGDTLKNVPFMGWAKDAFYFIADIFAMIFFVIYFLLSLISYSLIFIALSYIIFKISVLYIASETGGEMIVGGNEE